MVCSRCILHEPIAVQCTWQAAEAGHGRGGFLGKDDSYKSTLTIYMNYLSTVRETSS